MYVPTNVASANLASTIALAGTNTALTGAAAIPPAPLEGFVTATSIPSPIAINHQSVEGVGHQPFVWPETDAEPGAELLDLVGGAGQQVPALWIRVPGLAILRHHFRRVVGRVECNCQ